MEAYRSERQAQMMKLRDNAAQLQAIVAMLLEGRTKQAVMGWNTLALAPRVKDIRMSADGETLTLVTVEGEPVVLRLDDLLAELQALLEGKEV